MVGHDAAEPAAELDPRLAELGPILRIEIVRQQDQRHAGAVGQLDHLGAGADVVGGDQIVRRRLLGEERLGERDRAIIVATGIADVDVDTELVGGGPHGLGDQQPEQLALPGPGLTKPTRMSPARTGTAPASASRASTATAAAPKRRSTSHTRAVRVIPPPPCTRP